MPKIPTFTATARPTTEVGAIKTGLQISPKATAFAQLTPAAIALSEYYVKSEEAANKTKAIQIKNELASDIKELVVKNGNMINPREASANFSKDYDTLVSLKTANLPNNLKTIVSNELLNDKSIHINSVLNNSTKNLESNMINTIESGSINLISEILNTNNPDYIKQLPTRLKDFYSNFEKVDQNLSQKYISEIPKKITVASFYHNLNINPLATLQSFDKGAYPELKGEERNTFRNKALSEITKRANLLDKQIAFQSAQIFESKWNNFFAGTFSNDDLIADGDLQGIPVLQKQMIDLNDNIKNNKVTKITDFDDVITTYKKILNGDIKSLQDSYRIGFEVFSKSVLQRSDKFSKDTYNSFAKMFQRLDDPNYVNNHKKFFDFIDTASIAVKANPNFKTMDATYNTRLDKFYNEMYNRFLKGLDENKNSDDLLNPKSPNYIAKDLYKFIPDSAEIMKGLYLNINTEPKSDTIQRLPNESPEEYLKRIGG